MREVNVLNQVVENEYAAYNGDSCEVLKGLPTRVSIIVFFLHLSQVYIHTLTQIEI